MPKTSVNYEVVGKGPTLVMIAGLSSDLTLWKPIQSHLARHFQLILVDHRGVQGHYTIEKMAEDVLHLLDQLEVEEFFLLGHSMGGCVAQTVARRRPPQKLVLYSTSSHINPVSAYLFHSHIALRRISMEQAAHGIAPWVYSQHFFKKPGNPKAFVDAMCKDPQSIEGYKGQVEALLAFNSHATAHQIKVPTLVIAGEEDLLLPPQEAKFLHEQIRGSRFHLQPHMGHLFHVEEPKIFADLIVSFL